MATKESVVKALAHLDGNENFAEVLRWLQAKHDEAVKTGSEATELIIIGRAQGQQLLIREFMEVARNARTLVRR